MSWIKKANNIHEEEVDKAIAKFSSVIIDWVREDLLSVIETYDGKRYDGDDKNTAIDATLESCGDTDAEADKYVHSLLRNLLNEITKDVL